MTTDSTSEDDATRRDGSRLSEGLDAGAEALDQLEREALSVLSDNWGTSTNDLGHEVWKKYGRTFGGVSPQKRSSAWLQVLLRLERRGLVRRLDDLKPVAWQRVPQAPNAQAQPRCGQPENSDG